MATKTIKLISSWGLALVCLALLWIGLLEDRMWMVVAAGAGVWLLLCVSIARGVRLERHSEKYELLKIALDYLPAAVLLVDREMVIQFAGGQALRAADFDPVALKGHPVKEFMGNAVPDLYALALDGHESSTLHSYNGREYVSHGVPVNGGIVCVLVTSVDITAAHELRERTKRSIQRLRQGAVRLDDQRRGPGRDPEAAASAV